MYLIVDRNLSNYHAIRIEGNRCHVEIYCFMALVISLKIKWNERWGEDTEKNSGAGGRENLTKIRYREMNTLKKNK